MLWYAMYNCIIIIYFFILFIYVDLYYFKIHQDYKEFTKDYRFPSLRHVGSRRCQGLEGTSNDRLHHRCTETCRYDPPKAGCRRGHEDHGRDGLWASCQYLRPGGVHIFRGCFKKHHMYMGVFSVFSWDQPRQGVIVNLRVAGVHRQCRAIGWGWSSYTGTSCLAEMLLLKWVTCLCALCVFVVKGGEDQKTFVSSLNFEHVTSCPRCAGRFGPDRGMDSSTSLCAGLRVQAKDAISFGAIGTPGLLLVPDVAEWSTMTTTQNMLDKCFLFSWWIFQATSLLRMVKEEPPFCEAWLHFEDFCRWIKFLTPKKSVGFRSNVQIFDSHHGFKAQKNSEWLQWLHGSPRLGFHLPRPLPQELFKAKDLAEVKGQPPSQQLNFALWSSRFPHFSCGTWKTENLRYTNCTGKGWIQWIARQGEFCLPFSLSCGLFFGVEGHHWMFPPSQVLILQLVFVTVTRVEALQCGKCVWKKSYELHDKTCFCGDAFAPLEVEMVLPCTRPTFSPWVVLPKADCWVYP